MNNESPNSTQIINISSISKHLGIQPDKIREYNKSGTLYSAICRINWELSIKNDHIEILNSVEAQKIEHYIGIEKERKQITIYFDAKTKTINLENKGNRSYGSSKDIQNSYPMKGTVYTENNKNYLRIHSIYHTIATSPNNLYSGTDADLLRLEVLNIYKTSK